MILPDVNVLVAAHRPSHPHHTVANPWLSDAVNGTESVTIPDTVSSGFVRIVTHHRIFARPSTLDDAFAFLRALHAGSAVMLAPQLPDGLERFARTCTDAAAAGSLVPDAHLASTALGLGARVATLDRGFRRFDGLQVIELRV